MKIKESKNLTKRRNKPWERYSDDFKKKIVQEIRDGIIGQREASRKYKIHRRNLESWGKKFLLEALKKKHSEKIPRNMSTEEIETLKKRTKELEKALTYANLKIDGLETLIDVAEKELKIKIRKKRGSKQSKSLDININLPE